MGMFDGRSVCFFLQTLHRFDSSLGQLAALAGSADGLGGTGSFTAGG